MRILVALLAITTACLLNTVPASAQNSRVLPARLQFRL